MNDILSKSLPLTPQRLKNTLKNTSPLKTKQSYIKPLSAALLAVISLGAVSNSHAKVLFSDTSLSVLYGDDYELVPDGELIPLP